MVSNFATAPPAESSNIEEGVTKIMSSARIVAIALTLMQIPAVACAADWPQWLGPDRNGISPETGLLKTWPKEGPKLKWKSTELGGVGYSSLAVAKGFIYVLGAFGDDEHVVALDEKDGKKLWSTKIGKIGRYEGRPEYPGPRSTPTIDGDKLYALGSAGDLVCVDAINGNVIWRKSLPDDFGGKAGMWAYSESPLVDGDLVVLSPGGEAATIVALNKKDGMTAWKSAVPGGDRAAYGSPICAETGGVKQYVCFLHNGLVGVAASDGKFLWRYKEVSHSFGPNMTTPLFHNGLVFGTAGLGSKGGGTVKLTADKDKVTATEVWFNDQLKAEICGFLRVGDHLYGTPRTARLVCAEFATGKIIWRDAAVGKGALCVADGLLYVRGENGTVALVEPSPAGYKELGRFDQPDRSKKPAWPYPVVANGCLYLRDCGVLLCYDIRSAG